MTFNSLAKCIALILLLIFGTAHGEEADTSFNILLRLQSELVHVDGSAAEARGNDGWHLTDGWSGGNRNSSNFGGLFLDGSHVVTPALKVLARLSFNFNMDGLAEGSSRERGVHLGITGPLGTLLAGRLETPYKQTALGWDSLNGTSFQARGNAGRSGGRFGHGGYTNDSLMYSNRFGEVEVKAFVSVDEVSSPTSGDPLWSVSVTAPAGPVELILSHIDASGFEGGPDSRTGTKLGARYSEGPWTLAGHYEIRGEGLEDGDFAWLTGSYRWQQWQFSASHGRFSGDSGDGNDGRYSAVGARYSFEGAFSVHVGIRRTQRDVGGSENAVGIGLRALFNTGNLLSRS